MIKKHSETRLRSKIIFLVPTKNLLDQQTQYFEDHLPHYFSVYSIKSATEYAYGKKLFQKEERPIFIVMIHKVCLTLLRGGNMDISEIDHLIFDECHHAQKEHPYNLIMREFYFYNINFRADEKEWYADRPYILGLTASPIKTKIKDSSMYELGFEMKEQLKELCTNLNSKIVTIDFDKLEESLKRNLNTDFITFEMFAYLKKIHDPKNSINKTPDLSEVIQKNIESLSEEDRNIILNFSDILLNIPETKGTKKKLDSVVNPSPEKYAQIIGIDYQDYFKQLQNSVIVPPILKVQVLMSLSFWIYLDNILINVGVRGLQIFIEENCKRFKNYHNMGEDNLIHDYLQEWYKFGQKIVEDNPQSLLSPKATKLVETFLTNETNSIKDQMIIFVDQRIIADLLLMTLKAECHLFT